MAEAYNPNLKRLENVPRNRRHNIACIESAECPGVFEISCTCGDQTWTPWGAAHAEEIAKLHLWAAGAPPQKVITA